MVRRKSSGFDDLIEIVAYFPWWVGLALAVVSFTVLHGIAGIEVAMPIGIEGMGSFAGKQLYITLAKYGQFMFPIVFGFGALASYLKGLKRKNLFETVQRKDEENPLFDLT